MIKQRFTNPAADRAAVLCDGETITVPFRVSNGLPPEITVDEEPSSHDPTDELVRLESAFLYARDLHYDARGGIRVTPKRWLR